MTTYLFYGICNTINKLKKRQNYSFMFSTQYDIWKEVLENFLLKLDLIRH